MKTLKIAVRQWQEAKGDHAFRQSLYDRDKWIVDNFKLPELTIEELRTIEGIWPFVKPTNKDLIWNRMYKYIYGFDPYYVSDYQVQPIYKALNPSTQVEFLKDKAMIDIYCPELAFPHTYVKCIDSRLYDSCGNVITEDMATDILENSGLQEFIVKPSRDTGCGKGVKKVGGGKK